MAGRKIGIDTGGTFTDLVAVDGDGQIQVAKVPSTPSNPADAILAGIEALGGLGPSDEIIHGTTVALNALLTGQTAKVAFVTSVGFRDLIEVGRQDRPDIYALEPELPQPLVARDLRFEIKARIWPTLQSSQDAKGTPNSAQGQIQGQSQDCAPGFEVVEQPTPKELQALLRKLKRANPESIAVGLLHSWADPRHEQLVGASLEPLNVPVTLSGTILPEHREVERFSTALVNAALAPIMQRYLASLAQRLGETPLKILQSSGGTLPAARAGTEPVRVILSGPAGGVVGAGKAVAEVGFDAFVGLDMGGTSSDVAFGRARQGESFFEASKPLEAVRIAGHPVAVPTLDIHTIGCGGGSLVRVDAGGVLHVGPQSAGADPGPVAYGKSDQLTVTDAHVFLGHIAAGRFLGGNLELDLDGVARAFERLGKKLGVKPNEAARGVLEVARAAMQRAIGVMTMQRGKDPASLPLVAFGGAGGLQAAALAGALHMRAALVPANPGALSAAGMTHARALADRAQTVLEPLALWSAAKRRKVQNELKREAQQELQQEGAKAGDIRIEQALELRYIGQSFEVRVPESKGIEEAFGATHEQLFGYRLDDHEIELVCLRARATIKEEPLTSSTPRKRPIPKSVRQGTRRACFAHELEASVIDRSLLRPGHTFQGPALVEEYSGTTLVPPLWTAEVSRGGHLLLKEPQAAS